MRITKNQYYLLSEAEKKDYKYQSNFYGCYFEKNTREENTNKKEIDDFERLSKKKGSK